MSDWMLKELKLRFDEACEIVEQQQQRIAELEQQITRYREVIAEQASISAEHDVRMYAAEEQLSRYRSKYNNLLAVAHRDGGQYLAQHGEDAAGEDAITAILTAYHNNDCYQGAVEVEGYVAGVPTDISTELYFASGWSKELGKFNNKKVSALVYPKADKGAVALKEVE